MARPAWARRACAGTGNPRIRLQGFAVPLRIAEVVVHLHKIVNREIVFALIEPCAPTDDLLELDHRVDGPPEHDVANVACIHAGREFLRRGEKGGHCLFVVLKVPQVLLTEFAVVCRDALAIVWALLVLT